MSDSANERPDRAGDERGAPRGDRSSDRGRASGPFNRNRAGDRDNRSRPGSGRGSSGRDYQRSEGGRDGRSEGRRPFGRDERAGQGRQQDSRGERREGDSRGRGPQRWDDRPRRERDGDSRGARRERRDDRPRRDRDAEVRGGREGARPWRDRDGDARGARPERRDNGPRRDDRPWRDRDGDSRGERPQRRDDRPWRDRDGEPRGRRPDRGGDRPFRRGSATGGGPGREADSRGGRSFAGRDGGPARGDFRRPRGGRDRFAEEHDGLSREEVREQERAVRPGLARKEDEPPTPTDIDDRVLPRAVRAELRGLPKDLAAIVAAHLVMAGELVDEDPALALSHAQAARRRAARLPVVREATAEAAYAAGDWATALTEYRALHRMSGAGDYLPVMADCERALGRPREALKLAREAQQVALDPAMRLEMTIVEAGARADLGQVEEALRLLHEARTRQRAPKAAQARLAYAAADLHERQGQLGLARDAFAQALRLDEDEVLDAASRLARLGGHAAQPEEDLDIIAMMDDEDDEDADNLGDTDPDIETDSAPEFAAGSDGQTPGSAPSDDARE